MKKIKTQQIIALLALIIGLLLLLQNCEDTSSNVIEGSDIRTKPTSIPKLKMQYTKTNNTALVADISEITKNTKIEETDLAILKKIAAKYKAKQNKIKKKKTKKKKEKKVAKKEKPEEYYETYNEETYDDFVAPEKIKPTIAAVGVNNPTKKNVPAKANNIESEINWYQKISENDEAKIEFSNLYLKRQISQSLFYTTIDKLLQGTQIQQERAIYLLVNSPSSTSFIKMSVIAGGRNNQYNYHIVSFARQSMDDVYKSIAQLDDLHLVLKSNREQAILKASLYIDYLAQEYLDSRRNNPYKAKFVKILRTLNNLRNQNYNNRILIVLANTYNLIFSKIDRTIVAGN